jgi:hypothetical protein
VPIPLITESSDGPTDMLTAPTFKDSRIGLGDFGVLGRQRPVACDDDRQFVISALQPAKI